MLLAVFLMLSLSKCCLALGYDSGQASSIIAEADNSVKATFAAVAEAEEAGANVSSLVARLDEAGTALSEANVAFRLGDYENASLFAEQCLGLMEGMGSEAKALKTSAEVARQNQLVLTTAFSSVGLSVLFVAGLFGWRFVKARFLRRALKMKPEEAVEI